MVLSLSDTPQLACPFCVCEQFNLNNIMSKFSDESIKSILAKINTTYFLPSIQREFVWLSNAREHKIERLFDSLLRGYPIGCFLFWQVDKEELVKGSLKNFQLYTFIKDYDVEHPHNAEQESSLISNSPVQVVLDGQQRLTALYIGLCGSRRLLKPHCRGTKIYEKRELYLNLRHQLDSSDPDDCYQFEFKNPASLPPTDNENYWFKVGDILTTKSLLNYSKENNLGDYETDLLEKLKNAVTDSLISYFEETESDLDKVLNIFVRVNSGGTPLSKSDLLMSTLTASFNADIRQEMNELVDSIQGRGFEKCFSRDHALRACLIFIEIAECKFVLKNFTPKNIARIERQWSAIRKALEDASNIVRDLGYANQLASGYVIVFIAYYLFLKGWSSKQLSKNTKDMDAIRWFIGVISFTDYFTHSSDSKLSAMAKIMRQAKTFEGFNKNSGLSITGDDIDDALKLAYKKPGVFGVLRVLYPKLDYKDHVFQIDHIYSSAKYRDDSITNLQLLEGSENQSKSDEEPQEWIEKQCAKYANYKPDNYIDEDFSAWDDIEKFKAMRERNMRKRLEELFINPKK